MDDSTKAIPYALDGALLCRDIERTGSTYRDTPHVCSCLLTTGDDSTYHVPCLETLDSLGLLRAGAWKTIGVHPAHLPLPASCCRDV